MLIIIITLASFITLTIAIKLAEEREEYVPVPAVEFNGHVNEYDEMQHRDEHCVYCGRYSDNGQAHCSDECFNANMDWVEEYVEKQARSGLRPHVPVPVAEWDFDDDIPF